MMTKVEECQVSLGLSGSIWVSFEGVFPSVSWYAWRGIGAPSGPLFRLWINHTNLTMSVPGGVGEAGVGGS